MRALLTTLDDHIDIILRPDSAKHKLNEEKISFCLCHDPRAIFLDTAG